MKQQTGYLIARTKAKSEFFTSSSSYDRPQWKGLRESTVYPTVEMAQSALTKLLKNGLSYEARLVSLNEAMTFDFPNGEQITTPHRGSAAETPGGNEFPKDDAVGDMTSDKEGGPCSECGHEPCTCEQSDEDGHCPHCGAELDSGHDEGDGDITDPDSEMGEPEDAMGEEPRLDDEERRFHPEEEESAVSRARFLRGQKVTYRGAKFSVLSDDGTGTAVIAPHGDDSHSIRVDNTRLVGESEVKMPAKPAADGKPSDTKTPATKVDKVKFKQPAMTDAPVDFGGDNHDVKVKVPTEVMSELKAKIAEFDKEAEFSNTRDDAKASFLLTAVEAMKTLQAYLELGTVAGVKKAQISMTSMMSPIVNHIPPSVIKFISHGGKKPTLKNLFDAKRSEKNSAE
jgi:hypothetical protein